MALWAGAGAGKTSLTRAKTETPEDAFLEEAHKTPLQRLRDAILKKMGLTEDQLASMEPDQREAVEKEIVRQITDQAKTSTEKKAGFLADLRV